MKKNIILTFLCLCCFAWNGFGQITSSFEFRFKIWKNSVSGANYLGEYVHLYNVGDAHYGITVPPEITPELCPGDKLIIKNLCKRNGFAHSFSGAPTGAGASNAQRRSTIGIVGTAACSTFVYHLADVCAEAGGSTPTCSYVAPFSGYTTYDSWNYNTNITVEIPNYAPSGDYAYLSISAGNFSNTTTCSGRYFSLTRLNLNPLPGIDDQLICQGSAVNLDLNAGLNYSNWSPNNPEVISPTNTTNYTVDVSNGNCSITHNFKITVNTPHRALLDNLNMCYDDVVEINNSTINNQLSAGTIPHKITVNGTEIYNDDTNYNAFPFVIDGPTFGSSSLSGSGIGDTVTIEYTYYNHDVGMLCTKTYKLIIKPKIHIDMEDSYSFCDGNFGPISVLPSSIQLGITYKWFKEGGLLVLGSGPSFTPTAYGNYCVSATDAFGCKKTHCFTVYDGGLGINSPNDINFCSLTGPIPTYIGWAFDPLSPTAYTMSWKHIADDGTVTSLSHLPGFIYRTAYVGTGSYVVDVSTPGCSETFTINVTDLLTVYANHYSAGFSFIPLVSGNVACVPSFSMPGSTDIWTVTDLYGNPVPTTTYNSGSLTGIRFAYISGASYTVTLRREIHSQCEVYTHTSVWNDSPRHHRNNTTSNSLLTTPNINLQLSAYPNPTTGQLQIDLKGQGTEASHITIYNSLGVLVLEHSSNKAQINLDLSQLPAGIYQIKASNGAATASQSIIKQ